MRPERLYGTGPDNLWTLSATQHAVIELKTGVQLTSTGIAKKDADQLGGSVRWNANINPGVANMPVMLHPTDVLDSKAILVEACGSSPRRPSPS
jgi:hypothetical protein